MSRSWRFLRDSCFRGVLSVAKRYARQKALSVSLTTYDKTKTNGGGAQLHARVSCWALSEWLGARYVHARMTHVDHGPPDYEAWVKDWNDLFAFELLFDEHPEPEAVEPTDLLQLAWRVLRSPPRQQLMIRLTDPTRFTDLYPDAFIPIQPLLRQIRIKAERDATVASAICHFRAMQPKDVGFTDVRKSDLSLQLAKFRRVLERFDIDEGKVFLSPEARESYGELPPGITLDDSTGAISAFRQMCDAKLLLIGKSSLSYLAGVVCEGIVVYESFWHPPLQSWVRD